MIDAQRTRSRRGFTLIEMVVSIVLIGIIASALMSGFLLSLRAIPAEGDAGMRSGEIDSGFEYLFADSAVASAASVATVGTLTLTVPDQTGDDVADTVVYRLADNTASSTELTRAVNGGDAREIMSGIAGIDFSLDASGGTAYAVSLALKTANGRVHMGAFELASRPEHP